MHSTLSSTPRSSSGLWRRIGVGVAFVATVAMNALATLLPLAGRTTGEISDSLPSAFTPAGFTFAIWGVIYLALGAYAVYQALPAQKGNPRLKAVAPWFIASSVFNIAWLVSWHNLLLPLSMVFMVGLLVSLIGAYLVLGTGRVGVTTGESLLARVPFSLYLGWITVATVANATGLLVSVGWAGLGFTASLWSTVLILIATGIGLFLIRKVRDVPYTLVLIWAFVGIFAAQQGLLLVTATTVVAGLLLLVSLVGRKKLELPAEAPRTVR